MTRLRSQNVAWCGGASIPAHIKIIGACDSRTQSLICSNQKCARKNVNRSTRPACVDQLRVVVPFFSPPFYLICCMYNGPSLNGKARACIHTYTYTYILAPAAHPLFYPTPIIYNYSYMVHHIHTPVHPMHRSHLLIKLCIELTTAPGVGNRCLGHRLHTHTH